MSAATPNPEGFAKIMRAVTNDKDPESSHPLADELMAALLRDLGYGEAMDIYAAMPRWYA